MGRARTALLAALSVVAVSVTGCGVGSGDEDEGLPVRFVNRSAWDAHLFGCPQCGKRGVVLEEGGGVYFGWNEKRAWPVTYTLVVRGAKSTCPFIDPHPGANDPEAVGSRDIAYLVDKTGRCVDGPPSFDDL
ncbi:hypothetical protein ACIPRD_13915 [Streptomyces sp. NPDC090108]|uniref:hypothetical protein n=1 Tax=Streptomyces sp. NPDC090108 TaxID=3365947 RepID=UPI0038092D42